MRLLLDECVDEHLRLCFAGYDCQTSRFAGLAGLKNGKLLTAAEGAGFDVLITVDRHIPEQQNFGRRRISVLILRARTNRLQDLEPLTPNVIAALGSLQPGTVTEIFAD